ncbi:MAG: hypothetical protein JWQ66_260 [Mucilaginibacter sp.]|nr:hypothetical protein [Mucilaginibacter sp.]
MNNKTKQLLIKALIYLVLGFGIAFLWHKIKG